MSAYAINKVCWLAKQDGRFRQLLVVDPDRTLRQCVPALEESERTALLEGDIGALVAFGASRYLLGALGRLHLFGLDADSFRDRLRSACVSYEAVREAMYPGLSDQQAQGVQMNRTFVADWGGVSSEPTQTKSNARKESGR
jgi:hypothetical protein